MCYLSIVSQHYLAPKLWYSLDATITHKLYANGQTNGSEDIIFDLSERYITFGADASGGSGDDWMIKAVVNVLSVPDNSEPQLLAVAPTATNTTFRKGDNFTISLIFNEIVDSKKTGTETLNALTVNTSWGTATYSGGADSNVLYFTGTVKSGATGELMLLSTSNLSSLKDMSQTNGTATAISQQSAGGSVNTSSPNYTLTSNGVSAGIGSANLVVNSNKNYTSSVKYV